MDPFLGQISLLGCNFAPQGWALCQGQLLSIAQYTALFSLLGVNFGGDGRTNFQLPRLARPGANRVRSRSGPFCLQHRPDRRQRNRIDKFSELPGAFAHALCCR